MTDRKKVMERGWELKDGGVQILIKTSSDQLTHRFRLEKQMKVKIAIPHGSLPNTNAECLTVACPELWG